VIPIHELLSRIRWDREFGQGDFQIGYYDRILNSIIRVPFSEVVFPTDDHHVIQIMDQDGVIHSIPMHRIYEVHKDSQLVWQRKRSSPAETA